VSNIRIFEFVRDVSAKNTRNVVNVFKINGTIHKKIFDKRLIFNFKIIFLSWILFGQLNKEL